MCPFGLKGSVARKPSPNNLHRGIAAVLRFWTLREHKLVPAVPATLMAYRPCEDLGLLFALICSQLLWVPELHFPDLRIESMQFHNGLGSLVNFRFAKGHERRNKSAWLRQSSKSGPVFYVRHLQNLRFHCRRANPILGRNSRMFNLLPFPVAGPVPF